MCALEHVFFQAEAAYNPYQIDTANIHHNPPVQKNDAPQILIRTFYSSIPGENLLFPAYIPRPSSEPAVFFFCYTDMPAFQNLSLQSDTEDILKFDIQPFLNNFAHELPQPVNRRPCVQKNIESYRLL